MHGVELKEISVSVNNFSNLKKFVLINELMKFPKGTNLTKASCENFCTITFNRFMERRHSTVVPKYTESHIVGPRAQDVYKLLKNCMEFNLISAV